MLPFYPLNQHPAIDRYERETKPASRLEIHQQFLADERQRYVSMLSAQAEVERNATNPAILAVRAFHQGVTWLVSITRHMVPRHAAPSTANHICVPGVDC